MFRSISLILFFIIQFIPSFSQKITIKTIEEFAPDLYKKVGVDRSFTVRNFAPAFDKVAFIENDSFHVFSIKGTKIFSYDKTDFDLISLKGNFQWNRSGDKILLSTHFVSYQKKCGLFVIQIFQNNRSKIIPLKIKSQYTALLQPDCSFDSQLISYILTTRSSALYVKNLATGEETQISNPLAGNAKWLNHSHALLYRNCMPPYNSPKPPDADLWYYHDDTRENKQLIDEKMTDIEIAITEDDSLFLIKAKSSVMICRFSGKFVKILKNDDGMAYQFSPDGKYLAYLLPEYKDEMTVGNELVLIGLETEKVVKYPVSTMYNNFKWLNASLIVLIHQ